MTPNDRNNCYDASPSGNGAPIVTTNQPNFGFDEKLMKQQQDKARARLDGLAVIFSSACLIHCLVLPLLVVSVPVLQGSALMNEQMFHLVMLLFIVPTSALALAWGCRKHKDFFTLLLGGVGLTTLTVTALFGHDLIGLTGERIVTSIGGLILAAGHIRNFIVCRREDCDHAHESGH